MFTNEDMSEFLRSIPVRPPRKPKARKPAVTSTRDIKGLYYGARMVMYRRELPTVLADGHYYDNKFPDLSTTNGTQRYIRDVLNWLGHNADRNNTMGIPVKDPATGEIKWRRSGSTTGAADLFNDIKIPSHPVPVSWKIEVKKGADTLSKGQQKYKDKMDRVGVLHSIVYVGGLDWFWDEYERIMKI